MHLKSYIKPVFEYIEMRPEEKLSLAASCIEYGSCGANECESHWYGFGPQ